MSKKQNSSSDLILCEKDGYAPRKFTMQQLEAMGQDPGGQSYDGWKPTESPKEPKELKEAKAAKAPKEAATKNATKTTDNDASIQTAESAGEGNGLDSDSNERSDPAQGSEGDGKAD